MSTQRTLLAVVILAIAGFAVHLLTQPNPQANGANPSDTPERQSYSNPKYGLAFTYPTEYVLTEHEQTGGERERMTVVLIHKKDLPVPMDAEGPPSITVDIYQNNLDRQTTEGWIRGSSFSNFKLGDGTLASTTIGGKQALSYRWSGLYEGTTIAVADTNWVYAFSVMYLEMGDDYVQDFVAIRDSVSLSHGTAPTSK